MTASAIVETDLIGARFRVGEFAIVRAGVAIGDDVTIHPHAVVESGVRLSDGVEVLPYAHVGGPPKPSKALARQPTPAAETLLASGVLVGTAAKLFAGLRVGENTLLGDRCMIREHTRIGEETVMGFAVLIDAGTQVGSRTRAIANCILTGYVGDDVFLSVGATLVNDNTMGESGFREESIRLPRVGHRARIGANATLLPGVEVGEDAVVGAGSVVTRSVDAGVLVMGVPARVVRRQSG
jgi:acetyltransferase-like isoleucine patch superfamily enzyme